MPDHAVQLPIAAPRSAAGSSRRSPRARSASAARRRRPGARARRRAPRSSARARRRRDDAEATTPRREDPPLAVEVAERATDQDQRAEREQIGVGDPLLPGEAAAEVALDGRQRDVHGGSRRDPRRTSRGSRPGGRKRFWRSVTHPCYGEVSCCPRTASDAVPSHLGCSPPRPPPRGLQRLQSGGPRNPWASLSAARFRVGAQIRVGSDRGQEPDGGDPANSADFCLAVARPRTLGSAAGLGRRGEHSRHRRVLPAFWSLQ